jgi:hypothetical protein
VPFRHGFPLHAPNDADKQKAVLRAALAMLEDPAVGPGTIRDYRAA